ncbi:MAG: hypothetical protein KDC36_02510 [Thermoleophilia bacterium]|nr:hypothetical protein [Thermoleophilia bacterium]
MPVQVERCVEVRIWPVGGVEVRPTRVFLWMGPSRRLLRVVPLGGVPNPEAKPLREHVYRFGPVSARHLGNPTLTLAASGTRIMGRLMRTGAPALRARLTP